MLKILRYVFALVAMLFAIYGLITSDLILQPYMLLFFGLMLLIMGLEAFREEQKASGWFLVVVFLLLFSSSIQTLILR
ncbi:DUF3953 domain-containing protein [Oceanobacillus sp. CAU 1775]